jgi:hypothetical protein
MAMPYVKRPLLTDIEYLNASITTMIRKYSREAAMHQRIIDSGGRISQEERVAFGMERNALPDKIVRKAAIGLRRNEKSIALWTAKLLCDHRIVQQTTNINASVYATVRCNKCTSTAIRK